MQHQELIWKHGEKRTYFKIFERLKKCRIEPEETCEALCDYHNISRIQKTTIDHRGSRYLDTVAEGIRATLFGVSAKAKIGGNT